MQTQRTQEIWVGAFVAAGLAGLMVLALHVSGLAELRQQPGYQVSAYFDNVGGLREKAPVSMAGVRIGRVESVSLDSERHQARVVLRINESYDRIPADTSAAIYTQGLLGEQYIGLEAGWDDAHLEAGATITETQSAIVLERVIGQFLYNLGD